MKAIPVEQPFASLVSIRAKPFGHSRPGHRSCPAVGVEKNIIQRVAFAD